MDQIESSENNQQATGGKTRKKPRLCHVQDERAWTLIGGSDGAADNVDQAVSMAFSQCRRSNYVRIQADGSSFGSCRPNIDTDASPSNVKNSM
uniref:Uncharacterized protein n=1 Tax=Brassica campestris TaxID=3711 RepID=M4DKQ3_BRACM